MSNIEHSEETQEVVVSSPFWVKALLVVSVLAVGYLYYMVQTVNQKAIQDQARAQEQIAALKQANEQQTQKNDQQIHSLESSFNQALTVQNHTISVQGQKSHQEVEQRAQQLSQQLTQQTDQKITQVNSQITDLGNRTQTASNRIGEVDREVVTVKTNLADTQKTLSDTRTEFETNLRKVQGDLGVTNGYVATNTQEIAELRRMGERNYTEFTIRRGKSFQRFDSVGLRLDRADVKRKQFSLTIQNNDTETAKHDRSPNEPLQFYQGHALYEVVVNTVNKDQVAGYISAPRYPATK